MAECEKVGDFVAAGPIGEDFSFYGVISGFDDNTGFGLDIYDYGFPVHLHVPKASESGYFHWDRPINKHVVLSKAKYLEHLGGVSKSMDKKLGGEDLVAACWASRQHYLQGVMENIKDGLPQYCISAVHPPKTGVYVLCSATNNEPNRCSLSPDKVDLEGLVVTPRYSPRDVAVMIAHMHPNKFGKISPRNTNFTHCGAIMDAVYFVYEVPENAVDFVKNHNPFVLDLTLRKL